MLSALPPAPKLLPEVNYCTKCSSRDTFPTLGFPAITYFMGVVWFLVCGQKYTPPLPPGLKTCKRPRHHHQMSGGSWSWSSSWHQWDGGGAPPSPGPRRRGRGGGGGRGRGGAAQGTPRRAASEDELIYSTFPLNKQEFPEDGPNSFRELEQNAENAGCSVTLRSRRTQQLQRRAKAVLVIRGPSCREVYATFLDAAFTLGADLSMVLLPHEVQRKAGTQTAGTQTEPQAQPAAAATVAGAPPVIVINEDDDDEAEAAPVASTEPAMAEPEDEEPGPSCH